MKKIKKIVKDLNYDIVDKIIDMQYELLKEAVKQQNVEMVSHLVEWHHVKVTDYDVEICIDNNNFKILKMLLSKNKKMVNKKMLNWACEGGNLKIINYLLFLLKDKYDRSYVINYIILDIIEEGLHSKVTQFLTDYIEIGEEEIFSLKTTQFLINKNKK